MENKYIISWNCNGLNPHISELMHYLDNSKNHPIIICLQESNLYSQTLPNIPTYCLINTHRIKNTGGGTAIYIKSCIPYSQHYFRTDLDSQIEYTSITMLLNNHDITITSMYISPQAKINYEQFSLINMTDRHIIMGDLNGKHQLWGSPVNNLRGKIIYKFMEENNLVCINNGEGTRIGNLGQLSHLDIVLTTTQYHINTHFEVLSQNWGSDHYPLKINLDHNPLTINLQKTLTMNFNKTNWIKYTNITDKQIETRINPVKDTITIDELQETLTEIIIDAATTSTPIRTNTEKHKYSPFWNSSCDTAIKNRRKSEKHMRDNPTKENIITYKRDKAIVKLNIKKAKSIYWEKYCRQLNKNSNISNIWRTINRAKGHNQTFNPLTLLKTLNLNNMNDLCNNFSNFFLTMSADTNMEELFKLQKDKTIHSHLKSLTKLENLSSLEQDDITKLNQIFTMQELQLSLMTCNKKSSPGPDNIPYVLLDKLSCLGKLSYLYLVNRSWEEGQLPTNWKTSFVKPILKHNKPKNSIESYRPISLISCMSKIMEKMINTRLK